MASVGRKVVGAMDGEGEGANDEDTGGTVVLVAGKPVGLAEPSWGGTGLATGEAVGAGELPVPVVMRLLEDLVLPIEPSANPAALATTTTTIPTPMHVSALNLRVWLSTTLLGMACFSIS